MLCGPLLARLIEKWVPVHVSVIPGLDEQHPLSRSDGPDDERSADDDRPAVTGWPRA